MRLFASLLATCIPSRNFMGGARTWQLRACRRVHLLRRLHIRSLLAVFLLNFVFFPHGRRPYWRESLVFFPHNSKRPGHNSKGPSHKSKASGHNSKGPGKRPKSQFKRRRPQLWFMALVRALELVKVGDQPDRQTCLMLAQGPGQRCSGCSPVARTTPCPSGP